MRIYKFETREESAEVVLDEVTRSTVDDPFFQRYYEGSKKHLLKPKTFNFVNLHKRTLDRKKRYVTDIVSGNLELMFNQKARDALEGCWNDNCEFFEMRSAEYIYYMLNLLYPLENTIDYEHSDIIWINEQEKRASWINKVTFIPDNIGRNTYIFKPKEWRRPLVTDLFVEKCIATGLSGAEFILMYDSEDDSHVFPFKTIISL